MFKQKPLSLLLLFVSVSLAQTQSQQDEFYKKLQEDLEKLRAMQKSDPITVAPLPLLPMPQDIKPTPDPALVCQEKIWKHMGLLNQSADLASIRKVREGAVGGRYDYTTRTITLNPTIKLPQFVLPHEMSHSLQDNYYDIGKTLQSFNDNHDAQLALHALLDGDADVTAQTYAKLPVSAYSARCINGTPIVPVPPVYLNEARLKYGYGSQFVWKYCSGDFKQLKELYAKPPLSSKEILHPETYGKTQPYQVRISNPAGILNIKGSQIGSDVLGEIGIRTILNEKAAAGWTADRFYIYEHGLKLSSVWYTKWESSKDATEFLVAEAKHIKQLESAKVIEKSPNQWVLKNRNNEYTVVTRSGQNGADVIVARNIAQSQIANVPSIQSVTTISAIPVTPFVIRQQSLSPQKNQTQENEPTTTNRAENANSNKIFIPPPPPPNPPPPSSSFETRHGPERSSAISPASIMTNQSINRGGIAVPININPADFEERD